MVLASVVPRGPKRSLCGRPLFLWQVQWRDCLIFRLGILEYSNANAINFVSLRNLSAERANEAKSLAGSLFAVVLCNHVKQYYGVGSAHAKILEGLALYLQLFGHDRPRKGVTTLRLSLTKDARCLSQRASASTFSLA